LRGLFGGLGRSDIDEQQDDDDDGIGMPLSREDGVVVR
jgi:hypothetical protein